MEWIFPTLDNWTGEIRSSHLECDDKTEKYSRSHLAGSQLLKREKGTDIIRRIV